MTAAQKIKKYLSIDANKIFTKTPARIVLNLEEYKTINENYGEDIGISEIEDLIEIPGFFTIEFIDEGDSIDFFFPYNIYLQKTQEYKKDKDFIIIEYGSDEMIFYANYKEEETDIRILKSLFENGVKYLGDKPDKLLTAIWQQILPNTNIPWHHIEIIVSQLYGTYDKTTKEMLPLRLTDLPYSKKYIMNMKESAHNLNRSLPFVYGYSKDALRTMVSKKKTSKNSFYEDIIGGDYEALVSKSEKN
jgi:hypothetical protein